METRPDYSMKFTNPEGKTIGTLDFNGWVMTFDGAADESAINFFYKVSQMFSQRLDEEYQRGLNERKQ